MKKIILIFCLLGSTFSAYSQTCTRDSTITQPGTYPNQLPVGDADVYYEESVQFNIPADTMVGSTSADIDSIKVLAVNGLPPGLTYACNPLNCVLPGGETSCGVIYGTIDKSAAGTYPFVIPVVIYARVGGVIPFQQADTIYSLSMDVNAVLGEKRIIQNALMAYPNPAGNQLFVALPFSAYSAELRVFDRQGKHIQLPVNKEHNRISITTTSLLPGIYYGEVADGNGVHRFHFIRN